MTATSATVCVIEPGSVALKVLCAHRREAPITGLSRTETRTIDSKMRRFTVSPPPELEVPEPAPHLRGPAARSRFGSSAWHHMTMPASETTYRRDPVSELFDGPAATHPAPAYARPAPLGSPPPLP